MLRLILLQVSLFLFNIAIAQEEVRQTDKGKWLIEANTNFGVFQQANTSFQLIYNDHNLIWNIGMEGGYFIADKLAIKLGLGFGDGNLVPRIFTNKLGVKYYIVNKIPVQIDYSGAIIENVKRIQSYFGLQVGYSLFLSESVSLEPGLRYNSSPDNKNTENFLQLNVGFALHF